MQKATFCRLKSHLLHAERWPVANRLAVRQLAMAAKRGRIMSETVTFISKIGIVAYCFSLYFCTVDKYFRG